MQLTEAGISAWDILADKMKITTAQAMKMGEKGLIPADKAIKVLIDGMNTRFPNMMEKQSKTLQGLYSTMKDTFDNKILVQFGNGMASALRPRFNAIVDWINKNDATIKRWGATIERVVGSASDAIIRKFEKAGKYVKTHFIDNLEFQKLDNFESKISFIFDDIGKTFDSWYEKTGSAKLTAISTEITSKLATALSEGSGPITDAAFKLGGAIGAGMIAGLKDTLKEHPVLSGLVAGGATPGPVSVKAAAGASVLFSGNMLKSWEGYKKLFTTGEIMGSESVFGEKKYLIPPTSGFQERLKETSNAFSESNPFRSDKTPSSHAGGLSRVPYNGYSARLHKDEAVLTKAEADARRSGKSSGNGGVNIKITMGQVTVRNETDIQSIARELARQLDGLQGAF